MSGRKQHFIPQAIQRGFAAARGRKGTQVYVFPKGRQPYLSATEGVAAQRDFYSQPSTDETLDDRITNYEATVLGPAISALKDSKPGPIDAHAAAAVVVHLSIRSAFIRGTFSDAVQRIINTYSVSLINEEATRSILGIDLGDPKSIVVKTIEEELQKLLPVGVSSKERVLFSKMIGFRIREKFSEFHSDLSATAIAVLKVLLDRIPEIVLSGHEKALAQGLAPQLRVERLKAMNWQVLPAPPNGHFVLPDCLALGSRSADFYELEPYALLGDNELNGVVMPLSAAKVLVGCTGNPRLDVTKVNEAFASCSLDFVISSKNDADTRAAITHLGKSVKRRINELVDENFAPPPAIAAIDAQRKRVNKSAIVKFEPLSRKSGKSQAAVKNLLRVKELEDGMELVECIVVTDNVAHSLRQRGVKLTGILERSVMTGFCHVIESPSGVKCQLLVPTSLVDAIVRNRPNSAAAARLIRHQAGRAAYYSHLMKSIPSAAQTKPISMMGHELQRASRRIASHYFGARLSLLADMTDVEMNESFELWKMTTEECIREIERARALFLQSNDANVALPLAWSHMELLLAATATICAAECNKPGWILQAITKSPVLACAGLGEWVTLFSRDLEQYFDLGQNWSEGQENQLLTTHLERILWSFGILIDDSGPDQIWMNSLNDEHMEAIRRIFR